jgi:hypothetical protein
MAGWVHEVAALVGLELVMRPEGVIEGEVTVFAVLEVLGVEQLGHVADHVHAQLAAQVRLTLVEGTHPHSNFYTHIINMPESIHTHLPTPLTPHAP